ncbi:MAG: low molecular weight protein arginine phosphatase [Chthoniobacterales bacterium]
MASSTSTNVLFVCTGNTCRSPMAEGLLRAKVSERSDVEVRSAGISAAAGQPSSGGAVQAMRDLDIDISAHRSQPVSEALLSEATYVLAMTSTHLTMLELFFPQYTDKFFLLRSFSGSDLDVSDPIGQGPREYGDCRDMIGDAVDAFLKKLDTNSD